MMNLSLLLRREKVAAVEMECATLFVTAFASKVPLWGSSSGQHDLPA